MRDIQISIKIERFGKQAPDGKRHGFRVYADANEPYEAICAALYETLLRVQAHGSTDFIASDSINSDYICEKLLAVCFEELNKLKPLPSWGTRESYEEDLSVWDKVNTRYAWKSIEKALPADDAPVLVATESGRVCVGFYMTDLKKWFDYESFNRKEYLTGFYRDEVTHWQPLPQHPVKIKGV
jgi:hypothetical protein